MEPGLGAYSKTNLYDLILHLANIHSSSRFLDTRSNYQNAVDFKVTETKIKNSKLNIALKYKTREQKGQSLSNFFSKLTPRPGEGGIYLFENREKTHFEFTVEDPSVRMGLENLLKTETGSTLDHSFNSEKVKIEKICFFELIKNLSGKSEGQILKTLDKNLNNAEFTNKIKDSGLAMAKALAGFAVDITAGIAADIIKKTLGGTA
jgi:hypothetical protein